MPMPFTASTLGLAQDWNVFIWLNKLLEGQHSYHSPSYGRWVPLGYNKGQASERGS
jgi:hypothetical protein